MLRHPPLLPALFLLAWLPALSAVFPFNLPAAFPAPGATGIPPDTPLRLTFTSPVRLGAAGHIRIFEDGSSVPADDIDVSAPVSTKTIGGLPGFRYYSVLLAENTAVITLKPGVLAYGRSYYVTADAGVFQNGPDGSAAVAPGTWRFTTRAAPPVREATRLTVAADGTGDFCTVQGALDFVPDGNTTPRTLFIGRGTYHEIIFFTGKHALTLLGEDRRQTVIAYPNNEKFNPAGGNPYAGPAADPSAASLAGHIYHRGMILAHRVDDLTIANLTLRNTTPPGGSQAEALILNGTPDARAVVKDVDFSSYQDTIQFNGQTYVTGCFIEGDVDFMWGTGPCFFENCTVRSLRSDAYYTQVRNPATNHGFVYLRCTFDGAPGVTGNYLSRIEPHRFPHSEVVLLDCTLSGAVGAPGWLLQPPKPGSVAAQVPPDTTRLRFWESNSRTPDGHPVDVSGRLPASRQLTPPADAALLRAYADPATVLGYSWDPRLAPIFR